LEVQVEPKYWEGYLPAGTKKGKSSSLVGLSKKMKLIWVMLRHALDPDGPSERQLVFKMRKKGRRPHRSADSQIALNVVSKTEKGYKMEAAVQEAMKDRFLKDASLAGTAAALAPSVAADAQVAAPRAPVKAAPP
jgi:hypothetical protein